MAGVSTIPPHLLNAISNIERACSIPSLLGSLFIIATFLFSKKFHKPINRLVFYASIGNVMTNVGTLMSRSYLSHPDSVGCQFQAFLIQLFMPADAFWTLAMAVNVYLTFYFKFDATRLRRLEIPYLLICYGVPFIPAIIYIFVRNANGERAYGNATLWCWVSAPWGVWRVATFYGPVWVVIVVTMFIYLRAGRTIYEKRKQLYNFSHSDPDPLSSRGDATATLKTIDISVTTEIVLQPGDINLQPMSPSHEHHPDGPKHAGGSHAVAISAGQEQADQLSPSQAATRHRGQRKGPRNRNYEINNAAWGYTKVAILFFTALLITWIPSSANRVFSLVHNEKANIPLEFMSAFVLPLQGFWNAVIYVATSWQACKDLFRTAYTCSPTDSETLADQPREAYTQGRNAYRTQFKASHRSPKDVESESTTELALSHKCSDEYRPTM